MNKEDIKKRIKELEEEQLEEYEELDGDSGGRSTTGRYWEIENELEKLYDELDN